MSAKKPVEIRRWRQYKYIEEETCDYTIIEPSENYASRKRDERENTATTTAGCDEGNKYDSRPEQRRYER